MHFTPLERDVLDWIATRCDDAAIRAQLRDVEPVSREHTGAGAFLGLHVPGDVPFVPLRKAPVDPHIASPDLDDAGAGCVLFSTKAAPRCSNSMRLERRFLKP
jgi:hypothetical protein